MLENSEEVPRQGAELLFFFPVVLKWLSCAQVDLEWL